MTTRAERLPPRRRAPWLSILCALVLATASASPARAHDLELRGKLVEAGVLTLGVALTGRPFAYREDGVLRGFSIDLAAAVALTRGLALRTIQLPRKGLADALAAGKIDLINDFALDGRAIPGLASVPYLVVGDHMMVLKGNPFRIRAIADLAGHTVSTTAGSSAEAFAREIDRRLIGEGRKPLHIHSFVHQREVHFPVSMGHAAAYFVESASALVPNLDPESRVRVFAGVFQPRRQVGFGVRVDQRELRDAIEHALAAEIANETYDRLRRKHGIPDDLSPFR